MSCLDFTLVPNGAFLMCESVSEYDENSVPAEPVSAPVNMDQRNAELAGKISHLDEYPYVNSVRYNYRTIYEDIVKPLLNLPLDISTNSDIVRIAELISNAITQVVGTNVSSMRNLSSVTSECDSPDYINAELNMIVKNYLRYRKEITQNGYDRFTSTSTHHPFFCGTAADIVGKIIAAPELLSGYDIVQTLEGLGATYTSQFTDHFSSITDMYNVLFYDTDRFSRQSTEDRRIFNMSDYVSFYMRGRDEACGAYPVDPQSTIPKKFVALSSKLYRLIKQKMYDVQSSIIPEEETYNDKQIHDKFVKAITCVNNLFAIGLMLSMSMATHVDNQINMHTMAVDYTDTIRKKFPVT